MKSIIILHILFFFNLFISIYFFTNGFLIRRLSLNNTNYRSFPKLKRFEKAIVLFVDALRFDFIFSNKTEYFGLPTIETLIQNEKHNAKLFKFIADPPTTTMQRIKGLMSGSLPTFIDAGSNFNSYIIEDDNLIRQAYLNNKTVAILGDDTWISLFEPAHIKLHHTYPSFNIKDLDSNDNNVDRELSKLLKNYNSGWDIIIAHYLGIDHCGHSFGPKNPVIKRKLKDIDESIKFVVNSIQNDTILVLIGDHGMTETGDHGGDSKLELETVLFFYSKKELYASSDNVEKRINDMLFEEVKQIDLTPTLALVLGLPIPYSNLGIVLSQMFQFDDKFTSLKANYIQMNEFIKKYELLSSEKFIENNEKSDINDLFEQNENFNDALNLKIELKNYLKLVQSRCRERWSKFNIKYCLIGLISIFTSLISLVLFFNSLNLRKLCSNIEYLTIELMASAFIFLIINYVFCILFQSNIIESLWIYVILFNVYFISKFKFSIRKFSQFMIDLFRIDYMFVMFVYFIPYSNSFIINENNCLRFFLISFLFLDLFYKLKYSQNFDVSILMKFLIMLFLIRTSYIFYVCREEAFQCESSLFSNQLNKLDTNSNHSSYLLFISFNFIIITTMNIVIIYKLKLKSKFINFTYLTNLSLLFLYKYMQLIEQNEMMIKTFNFYLARIIYVLIFLTLIKIYLLNTKIDSKLSYVIISYGHLITLISSESIASIWFLISLLFIFINYETSQKLRIYSQSDPLIFLFLVKYYFFYATGHETTFTHIRWDSGFHGINANSNNIILRLLMGFLILSNTFSSLIITSISMVIYFYRENRKHRQGLENSQVINRSYSKTFLQKMVTIGYIKVLSTAFAVYLLRRHLMVWKIFGPRYVYESVGFMIEMGIQFLIFIIMELK